MALHERDVVSAVDEARRLREDLSALRAAYTTAERSRAGRLRAGWFALKSALLGRDTDPLRAFGRERGPAVELASGRPAQWPGEARSAARQRQARLRSEVAQLARNLAEARVLARALATERDAARAAAADLRARVEALRAAASRSEAMRGAALRNVEHLQADVDLLGEDLAQARKAVGALAAERDAELAASVALESDLAAERATVQRLRASLAELQAVVERERRSAHDVANAGLQLLASLALPGIPASTRGEVEADSKPGIIAAHRSHPAKTILMIESNVPEPDEDSGSNRLVNIIKLFLQSGLHVIFLPDNFSRSEAYTTNLEELGVEVLHRTEGGPHIEGVLRERLALCDYAWISRVNAAAKYMPLVREFPEVPLLYDTVDLHHVRGRRVLELDGVADPEVWSAWERERALEMDVIRAADVVIAVTDVERQLLEDDRVDNVCVVPNTPAATRDRLATALEAAERHRPGRARRA